jgi:hypothetical protein
MARITRAVVDRVSLQFVNVSHSHYHGSFSLATQMADMSFASAPFLHLPRRIKAVLPEELPVFAIGRIDTLEIAEQVLAEGIADKVGMTESELAERARSFIPLGRLGTPEDVAEVVAFLVDEGVTWITGQTIWLNGGDLMP